MKLVVGLGNPGRKYEGTRHNVGFVVLDRLAAGPGSGKRKACFDGEAMESDLHGAKTLLLWPHTYMNLSGRSVAAARDFYKIDSQDLLVVCDDFHLPLAKLRFRAKGTAGGQRGLDDVLKALGSQEVARLRIGVGTPPPEWDPADFVLGRFTAQERAEIGPAIDRAAEAVAAWARHGIDYCMNHYH